MTPIGDLGPYGIWQPRETVTPLTVALVDELGFSALWIGNGPPADLEIAERALEASDRLTVVTSIVNIARAEPASLSLAYHRVSDRFPGRFVLGVGSGRLPFDALAPFLDELEDAGIPRERMVVGALSERAVRQAGERTAGAHPYLSIPRQTALSRTWLGAGPLLVPEQKVVLGDDPADRAVAEDIIRPYFSFPTFRRIFDQLGYTADLADGGTERVFGNYIVSGSDDSVRNRLDEHLRAGADHVAIQVVPRRGRELGSEYRALATVLHLDGR